jgi:hypothetical protein
MEWLLRFAWRIVYPLAELAREVDENNRNLLDVNQCGGALKG